MHGIHVMHFLDIKKGLHIMHGLDIMHFLHIRKALNIYFYQAALKKRQG